MASPSAQSPPYPSHSQLPGANAMPNKKRTAEAGGGPAALKRRKASAISTTSAPASAHPLRQTSFPPDDSGMLFGARSPSVDVDAMSLVSGSQVSAAAPLKKKRGRKSKADKAREQTPSAVGGRAPTATSGASDGPGRGAKSVAGGAGGDEGDGDEEGPTEVAVTADVRTQEQKEEEHRARGMLISAFSEPQFHRYENWRAANLSKASVRRLVNSTISQSVAENVVIGMRAVSKVFIGDIIETARRVQSEWIATTGEKQTDLPTPPTLVEASPSANGEIDATGKDKEAEGEDRRGPMRPEHLREALRRYRKSQEGGGVGMQLIWHQQQQNGVERFPTRTGGRRIFR
ncbi:transcription initiation factor TFIID-like protein [Trichocladium antarcticum]|uniref:Transcription initiation factor TFIID-like protein n=1 Tax=Trichocladium antarcticum TaxID=1450529 RepID=A0AAN6UCA5_9PEZI|nr:transcription initiation factor TFIID-like protein [Trichocladium antarcticum]